MPPDMEPKTGTGGGAGVATPPASAERTYQPPEGEREPAAPAGGEPKVTPTPKEAAPVVTKGGLKVEIPKPRSRFQERITDLVEQRRQREEESKSLRARLAKYEGEDGQPVSRGSITKLPGQRGDGLGDPNAPLNPEEFETYGQYVEALVTR